MVRMIILVARMTTPHGARGAGGPEGPKGPTGRHFRGPKGATGRHFSKKCNFLWGVHFLSRPIAMDLGPRGPRGPVGPHRAPWGPLGPRGPKSIAMGRGKK